MWEFVDHNQGEPTNNAVEGGLRQAMIWLKLWFGAQSDAGSRFVQVKFTVVEPCRQQGRSGCDLAVAASTAHHSRKTPTLFAGA